MGNYHSFERIKAIALCQIFVYPSTQINSLVLNQTNNVNLDPYGTPPRPPMTLVD